MAPSGGTSARRRMFYASHPLWAFWAISQYTEIYISSWVCLRTVFRMDIDSGLVVKQSFFVQTNDEIVTPAFLPGLFYYLYIRLSWLISIGVFRLKTVNLDPAFVNNGIHTHKDFLWWVFCNVTILDDCANALRSLSNPPLSRHVWSLSFLRFRMSITSLIWWSSQRRPIHFSIVVSLVNHDVLSAGQCHRMFSRLTVLAFLSGRGRNRLTIYHEFLTE